MQFGTKIINLLNFYSITGSSVVKCCVAYCCISRLLVLILVRVPNQLCLAESQVVSGGTSCGLEVLPTLCNWFKAWYSHSLVSHIIILKDTIMSIYLISIYSAHFSEIIFTKSCLTQITVTRVEGWGQKDPSPLPLCIVGFVNGRCEYTNHLTVVKDK